VRGRPWVTKRICWPGPEAYRIVLKVPDSCRLACALDERRRHAQIAHIGSEALFSADHGAAATQFGIADLGVARFQHLRLGKLRFSFAE
jgi:hypothetical protein